MNSTVMLIYDNTGFVHSIVYGQTTVPEGIQGIIATPPTRWDSVRVDMETLTPIWEVLVPTEDEITNLQNALVELEMRVAELEGGNN